MKKLLPALLLGSALILSACGNTQEPDEMPSEDVATSKIESAISDLPAEDEPSDATTEEAIEEITGETIEVTMLNTEGEESGTATFTETSEGVNLTYNFTGLPEGEFGMHIHEKGLATAPTFEDAGGHWNPTEVEHGTDSKTGPHLGDLPNISVGSSGEVSGEELLADVTLSEEGKYSLHNAGQGTALIIHAGADDYQSQPTGNAGDRQLGGVIVPN